MQIWCQFAPERSAKKMTPCYLWSSVSCCPSTPQWPFLEMHIAGWWPCSVPLPVQYGWVLRASNMQQLNSSYRSIPLEVYSNSIPGLLVSIYDSTRLNTFQGVLESPLHLWSLARYWAQRMDSLNLCVTELMLVSCLPTLGYAALPGGHYFYSTLGPAWSTATLTPQHLSCQLHNEKVPPGPHCLKNRFEILQRSRRSSKPNLSTTGLIPQYSPPPPTTGHLLGTLARELNYSP